MTNDQMLLTIRENCEIWDKWSYDSDNECFVFFTLHDAYEIRENVDLYRYKAKTWIAADTETASYILGELTQDQFRTFTSHTETWEFEKVG